MVQEINLHLHQWNNEWSSELISHERKSLLEPIRNYVSNKLQENSPIRLNSICTHNSRRSIFTQVWLKTWGFFFNIPIEVYSGGTEATQVFPQVLETLHMQGFWVEKLSTGNNPVYAIKYNVNEPAIVAFSKVYNHPFNPKNQFAAIMTCQSADENCPLVLGAEARFSLPYTDPKAFDNTPQQAEAYQKTSLQIAREIWWVFRSL